MDKHTSMEYRRIKMEEELLEKFKVDLKVMSNRALLYTFQQMMVQGSQKEIEQEAFLIAKKEVLKRMDERYSL
jgi:hypothetical protein